MNHDFKVGDRALFYTDRKVNFGANEVVRWAENDGLKHGGQYTISDISLGTIPYIQFEESRIQLCFPIECISPLPMLTIDIIFKPSTYEI